MTKGMALPAICCLLLAAAMCAEGAEVTFREGGGSGYIDLTWDVVSIITTSDFDPNARPPWEPKGFPHKQLFSIPEADCS